MSDPPVRFTGLDLDNAVVQALQAVLPHMAEQTVAAVTVEVPAYADAFTGRLGQNIENAVQMALGAFLRLATRTEDSDAGTQLSPALDGAYELGRGEARNGRSIDALLSAYRVGARVAWRELSTTAVDAGLPAATIAGFAELVFAFIDELSASSVSGHADELATTGRVRQRYLERLAMDLLSGEPAEQLHIGAAKANWQPPQTLTAVLLPIAETRRLTALFGQATLQLSDDLPGLDSGESLAALLVPDIGGRERQRLLTSLAGKHATVGPCRPWWSVESSYRRALRARTLVPDDTGVIDTEERLVELVLSADREAVQDLRGRALAPLATLRPNAAQRLTATLRAWLLRQGQRDAVAADLFIHPQTVRYRIGQLRELYGERLDDPQWILELTVALGLPDLG